MFIIGGFGYIVPALLFWCFGSAEIQSWNEITKKVDIDSQETQEPQKPEDSPETNGVADEDKHTKL